MAWRRRSTWTREQRLWTLWLNVNHFYYITWLQIDFVTESSLESISDVAQGLLSPCSLSRVLLGTSYAEVTVIEKDISKSAGTLGFGKHVCVFTRATGQN